LNLKNIEKIYEKGKNRMKTIMVMFDSLNLHMLEPYGCSWVKTPNFKRLAEKSVVFDKCYVGSMPCMPARREIHTGRYNFLHRSWGPLEPFDDSMPEILKKNGVYSYLVSDHYHYWEEGGTNYHTKYSGFEFIRGQEGDFWIGDLGIPEIENPNIGLDKGDYGRQDWINRSYMHDESEMPMPRVFKSGIEFIEKNYKYDNWFLHIETFDPHEPYSVAERFKDLYDYDFSKFHRDWPEYTNGETSPNHREMKEHFKFLNAALVSMCDEYLGKVLDIMDRYNLWADTMLIVNTDHGFLFGEHDWWGKCRMPFYNEIAHIPLFIWDPRSKVEGERRNSLVQTIDIAPTVLEFFNSDIPEDMSGKPLRELIVNDAPVRDCALFGIFGAHVNVTDGKYVYMRAPEKINSPLYQYTYMPAHMRESFSVESMHRLKGLSEPFSFTKGCRLMKIDASGPSSWSPAHTFGNLLFDIEEDPQQETPINSQKIENLMKEKLIVALEEHDAPAEQFERLHLKS
jgi:arylsulfatase A-like enzyme